MISGMKRKRAKEKRIASYKFGAQDRNLLVAHVGDS